MAGENALPIQECPDHFQDVTWGGAIAEDVADGYFYYCERDTIVDAVFAITDTADNDVTVDIKKGAGGTSVLTTVATTATVDTIAAAVVSPTENFVSAGTTLHVDVTNVNTATGVLVQARIRTRVR
jgi:hypothetical protein